MQLALALESSVIDLLFIYFYCCAPCALGLVFNCPVHLEPRVRWPVLERLVEILGPLRRLAVQSVLKPVSLQLHYFIQENADGEFW